MNVGKKKGKLFFSEKMQVLQELPRGGVTRKGDASPSHEEDGGLGEIRENSKGFSKKASNTAPGNKGGSDGDPENRGEKQAVPTASNGKNDVITFDEIWVSVKRKSMASVRRKSEGGGRKVSELRSQR